MVTDGTTLRLFRRNATAGCYKSVDTPRPLFRSDCISVDLRIKPRKDYSHEPSCNKQKSQQPNPQEREPNTTIARMTNPAKTVWWETYQLWDEVLHQVGKAYYKARPPKKGSRSRTGPKPAITRSHRTTGKISSSRAPKLLEARHEPQDMQLVRQRSYSLEG